MPAGAADLSDVQKSENVISEALVSQFLAADVIVVGAPLYNFSVPSLLKAWIDRVAQVGRTFRYTEKGPQGLAMGEVARTQALETAALKIRAVALTAANEASTVQVA